MALILFILGAFLCVGSVNAEVYQYTDSAGRTHFVDALTKIPEEFRSQVKTSESLPKITKMEHVVAPVRKSLASGKKVEVFVTSWCPYCRNLEAFLSQKSIAYKSYDVEKDAVGKRIYQQLGGGGVPVVKIGTQVIRGFDPAAILNALDRR